MIYGEGDAIYIALLPSIGQCLINITYVSRCKASALRGNG